MTGGGGSNRHPHEEGTMLSDANIEKLVRADTYMDEIMNQLGVTTPADALAQVILNKSVADTVRRVGR
jgi:hypothetical protein